jgi:hypothetical protein
VRVKISYGADIEEVPEEVDQLYTYVSGKVRSLTVQTEHIEDALGQEELEMALPLIDKMRRTLASIDQRLADIEMISTGFLNHKQGGSDVHERRSDMAATGNGTDHNQPSQSKGV